MLSIIIPSKTDRYLGNLLHSMSISEPDYLERCRVIVIDDGLSEGFKAINPGIIFLPGYKPFCFAKNVNMGVALAQELEPGSPLLIQNDDTRLKSGHFMRVLDGYTPRLKPEGWGVVSLQIMGHSGNYEIMKRVADITRTTAETIPFIAVLIDGEVWADIGPLDERFNEYGWEDVAFCFKARSKGLKLGWMSGARVLHEGNGSFKFCGGDLEQMSRSARDIFFRNYAHPLSRTFDPIEQERQKIAKILLAKYDRGEITLSPEEIANAAD